jgi:hypothetical protein
MKRPTRSGSEEVRWRAAAILAGIAVMMMAGPASGKKKEKVVLPDYVLKAETVLVVILPDAGEPLDDPLASRKLQEEVEKALMKWGRFRLVLDAETADLVIGVRKGTGKVANPTINGGPVDTRPGTVETTDNQIRVGVQQGRPPATSQSGQASTTDGGAHTGIEAGARDDMFKVFQGKAQFPVDNAPVWKYQAQDGLKAPEIKAVAEFRKVVEEAEKAAKQKQQQQQQGQKKNP